MRRLLIILFLFISICGFSQSPYFVSPTGNDITGDGTIGNPWADPEFAALKLVAGDKLYLRGGTYYGVNNNRYGESFDDIEIFFIPGNNGTAHSGTALNPITMMNYNDEEVIFDGSQIEGVWYRNYGIYLYECDYWHIKGIKVTNMIHQGYDDVPQKYCPAGIYLYETQYCTIEECKVFKTEGRGIDIQMDMGVGNRLSTGNLILNCDAYDNYDLYTKNGDGSPNPGGNGDGFGATMMFPLTRNYFRGCRSWFNGDDGYDNIVNGGKVYIDSCWAWLNGRGAGNGEGFKLGNINAINNPHPDTTYRWVTNSVAIYNLSDGFAGNGLEGIAILYNNIAMYNTGKGFNWDGCRNVATVMRNNIADLNSVAEMDVQIYDNFIEDHNSWNMSPNYLYTSDSVLIYRTEITSVDQFESLDSTGISGARTNGVLPVLDFLKLKSTSVYINAGTDVGIDYIGDNPDLGPFEYNAETPHSGIRFSRTRNGSFAISKRGTILKFDGN